MKIKKELKLKNKQEQDKIEKEANKYSDHK